MAIEVDLVQGSQEWLDFRRTKRMASETPIIMGVSPWQKPKDVVTVFKIQTQSFNQLGLFLVVDEVL